MECVVVTQRMRAVLEYLHVIASGNLDSGANTNVRVTRTVLVALALVLVLAQPARADYEAGQHAWDAGRPVEALEQWQAAADDGDRRAMLALGRLYTTGLGAPQNFIQAHMWFNLAASRGEMEALAERDALAAKMTAVERAEAQKLASSWRPGDTDRAATQETVAQSAAEDPGPPPVEALREAQALLAVLGYDPGPADGIWGRRSVRAYQSFLRDAGQPLAEALTPEALLAMRAIMERQDSTPIVATGGRQAPEATAAEPTHPALSPDALHRAAKAGDLDGLKTALEAGVDVDARDDQGWTALMYAANKGYTLLVQLLLQDRAEVDIRAPDGATALFIAVLHGHVELVELLMKEGADIFVRGPKGRTPLEIAQMQEYSEILNLPNFRAQIIEEENRRREEEAQEKREEEAREFANAESLDTPQAYEYYLSSQCPGGAFCAEARARRDKSLIAYLSNKTFGGVNTIGDEQVYEFSPTGSLTGVARPSSWTSTSCSGKWRVAAGKVLMECSWLNAMGESSAIDAELKGTVLMGQEKFEGMFSEKTWTWRMTERNTR